MSEYVPYSVVNKLALSGGKALKTKKAAGYYDCGYGCQYYSYDPTCQECNIDSGVYYRMESVYHATLSASICSSSPDHTITDLFSPVYGDVLRDGVNYFNEDGSAYTTPYAGYYSNSLGTGAVYGTFSGGIWSAAGQC